MALLDGAGHQILQATRDGAATPTTIVLQPGDEATVQVAVSSLDGKGNVCTVTSPAFLFTLPDNTDSTRINDSLKACDVRVGAFVKGAGNGDG